MSSFYLSLNSDGSQNIHPDNHGGNFTIELHDTLDLTGCWEVALVEMIYFGQYFQNVPVEYGKVKVFATRSGVQFDKYIVTCGKVKDLYIDIYMSHWNQIGEDRGWPAFDPEMIKVHTLTFKKNHYTWKSFRSALNRFMLEWHIKLKFQIRDFAIKCNTDNHTVVVIAKIGHGIMKVQFSPELVKLLTLSVNEVTYEERLASTGEFEPIIFKDPQTLKHDGLPLMFKPSTDGDLWMEFEGLKLEFPKIHLTLNQFVELIEIPNYEFRIERVEGASFKYQMTVIYLGNVTHDPILTFSDAIKAAMCDKEKNIRFKVGDSKYLKINYHGIQDIIQAPESWGRKSSIEVDF